MSLLLVLPILIPLGATAGLTLLRSRPRVARVAGVAALVALLASGIRLLVDVWHGGIIAGTVGGWPAPFGITLVADTLSALMVVLTGGIGLVVGVFALVDVTPRCERLAFHPLFHALLAGVAGSFLTGDVFNLYVFFEVLLMASFGLLVLGGDRVQIDGAVKYVAINLVSTTLLLVAIGLLYGLTGTLNLADLHQKVPQIEDTALRDAVAALFFVAFGIKAAIFPLFFWMPASYHTPAVSVTAVFAGLLTKVGVYGLIRTFTLLFPLTWGTPSLPLLVAAALTMVSGVLGAASQAQTRRILAFHSVSQIGYMLLGLALATPLAMAGAIFYVVHHSVVKASLFLISGLMRRIGGSFDLQHLGGLYRRAPALAVLFLVSALSLAGFPPLSGFWAKLLLIRASFDAGVAVAAAVALLVGFVTIYSMIKIWLAAFWQPPAPEADAVRGADVGLAPAPAQRWLLLAPRLPARRGHAPHRALARPSPRGCRARGERGPRPDGVRRRRLGEPAMMRGLLSIPAWIGLVAYVAWDAFVSGLRVAWEIVTPRSRATPGILRVPIELDSASQITLLSHLITLSPGTVTLDVSEAGDALYVHVMFLDDPEEERRRIREKLERRVRRVLA